MIVVDDGSEERHLRRVEAACRETGATLVTQENAGPAAARNTGAAIARGDYLAFIDDDCEPEPDWLIRLSVYFSITPAAGVGGRTVNALDTNAYASASQRLLEYLYDYYDEVSRQDRRFFASNNFALPLAGFESLAGFDETFTLAAAEDRDFCNRWLHEGNVLVYAPDAVVRHAHAMTFAAFCRQHFNYGRGSLRYQQARARRRLERVRVEPLGFYAGLLARPFSHLPLVPAARVSGLLFTSQVANAAGFLAQGAGDSFHHVAELLRLPPSVASFYVRAHRLARRAGDEWSLMSVVPLSDLRDVLGLARGRTNVVEIGTGTAWTAIALALADPRRWVRTYDPAVRHERDSYLGLVGDDVRSRIRLVEPPGQLPGPDEAPVDLLFVDRSDGPDGIVTAFEAWEPHLLPGARVLFHDYGDPDWPGVAEAIEKLDLRGKVCGRVFVWTTAE